MFCDCGHLSDATRVLDSFAPHPLLDARRRRKPPSSPPSSPTSSAAAGAPRSALPVPSSQPAPPPPPPTLLRPLNRPFSPPPPRAPASLAEKLRAYGLDVTASLLVSPLRSHPNTPVLPRLFHSPALLPQPPAPPPDPRLRPPAAVRPRGRPLRPPRAHRLPRRRRVHAREQFQLGAPGSPAHPRTHTHPLVCGEREPRLTSPPRARAKPLSSGRAGMGATSSTPSARQSVRAPPAAVVAGSCSL